MIIDRPDTTGVRTVNPSTWPQYPYDEQPHTPESSQPIYELTADYDIRIPMRDGITLAADVYRPAAPGKKFPALFSASPYTRQLQQTLFPVGNNEMGITEFWVPRGYVHVIVDVRGINDSEGSWEMWGPTEQRDLYDLVEWIAQQPWCDGNVGGMGCSSPAMAQVQAALQQPPHLKAIFALDAQVDRYRGAVYHGGIFAKDQVRSWLHIVAWENLLGGRLKDPSGIHRMVRTVLSEEHPFDGPFYWERSTLPRLDRLKIPTYFVSSWQHLIHLTGAFLGWEMTKDIPKRVTVGPHWRPLRPTGAYHVEALRWYDHWFKGMNTGVMEGPPIRLYIQGANTWRGEWEWPLARTQWRELFLANPSGDGDGLLLALPGADTSRTYTHDPFSREALFGRPQMIYRTEPLEEDTEVTGPIVFHLWASTTAEDMDWIVNLYDEAPDGSARWVAVGWLRGSHREVDETRSRPWRPWHPHTRSVPLTPGETLRVPHRGVAYQQPLQEGAPDPSPDCQL